MYCPPAFAETRAPVLAALIRAHPLGLLVTVGADGPVANPVPLQLTGTGQLRAHLARANHTDLPDLERHVTARCTAASYGKGAGGPAPGSRKPALSSNMQH